MHKLVCDFFSYIFFAPVGMAQSRKKTGGLGHCAREFTNGIFFKIPAHACRTRVLHVVFAAIFSGPQECNQKFGPVPQASKKKKSRVSSTRARD